MGNKTHARGARHAYYTWAGYWTRIRFEFPDARGVSITFSEGKEGVVVQSAKGGADGALTKQLYDRCKTVHGLPNPKHGNSLDRIRVIARLANTSENFAQFVSRMLKPRIWTE